MSYKLKTDDLGLPIYTSADVFELLYQGKIDVLEKITAADEPDIHQFNSVAEENGLPQLKLYSPLPVSKEEFDQICQSDWRMPDEYKSLDIEQWVRDQTPPWDPEDARVEEELAAFREHNMIDLLRWLKYFVDTCRANNILWGVGRGSSVASYVLYIIGVHKINSLKYNLDWREFLR